MAQRNGYITSRQRKVILDRAREMGENIVEVEFYLDCIPIMEAPPNAAMPATKPKKKKKGKAWIWIILVAIAAIGIGIAVLSSDDYDIFTPTWDSQLTKYENGCKHFESDLLATNVFNSYALDALKRKYEWLIDLHTELENADRNGMLTPAQSARFRETEEEFNDQIVALGLGAAGLSFFGIMLDALQTN